MPIICGLYLVMLSKAFSKSTYIEYGFVLLQHDITTHQNNKACAQHFDCEKGPFTSFLLCNSWYLEIYTG